MIVGISVLAAKIDAMVHRRFRECTANGCFDLLHPGHIKLLGKARTACDRLIVGLNGDASVRRLKDEGVVDKGGARPRRGARGPRGSRPRRVFDQNTPLDLIHRVRPKVLINDVKPMRNP